MTNDEIRRMMELVDDKYLDELTDKPIPSEGFAEEETYQVEVQRGINWRAFVSIAAALVLVAGSIGGGIAMQKKIGLTPGQVVDELELPDGQTVSEGETVLTDANSTQYFHLTLAQANLTDGPWRWKVLTAEAIGEHLHTVSANWSETVENGVRTNSALELRYNKEPGNSDMEARFLYTRTPAEDLTSERILAPGDLEGLRQELLALDTDAVAQYEFVVDYGDYRVSTAFFGCFVDDIDAAIRCLQEAGARLSPEEVNSLDGSDLPWMGKILHTEDIGVLTWAGADGIPHREVMPDGEDYPCMSVPYNDITTKGRHSLDITYTLSPVQKFAGQTEEPNTFEVQNGYIDPEGFVAAVQDLHGAGTLWLDYGDYRVRITSIAVKEEEARELAEALNLAAGTAFKTEEPSAPEIPDTEDGETTLTYDEAKAIAGDYLPYRTLGSEEYGTQLTMLDDIQFSQTTYTEEDGTSRTVQRITFDYVGNDAHTLTVSLLTAGEQAKLDSDIPELPDWSMKCVTIEPYAVTVEDEVQDYRFWRPMQQFDVIVQGRASIGEIDYLTQEYGMIEYAEVNGMDIVPHITQQIEQAQTFKGPWQGHIVTEPEIGGAALGTVYYSNYLTASGETIPSLMMSYGVDNLTCFSLLYTNASAEEQFFDGKGVKELTGAEFYADDRFLGDNCRICIIDFGDYTVRVTITNGTEELFDAVYQALCDAE